MVTTQTREPRAEAVAADAEDAKRAAAGDARAFERLYRRHGARIHTLARRMLGEDEADEATQEAFVRAWKKLDTFRGDAAFGTWLHRVAINVILAHRAALAKRRERFPAGEAVAASSPARPVRTDLRVDFEAAIATLPDGAREVFVLYDVEGYKHEEIAARLGVSTGTSKSQLHRARMLLRGYLKE
ncbi:MAG TPA: RNA polymerase sigma factor [Longimicrobiales bacterium]